MKTISKHVPSYHHQSPPVEHSRSARIPSKRNDGAYTDQKKRGWDLPISRSQSYQNTRYKRFGSQPQGREEKRNMLIRVQSTIVCTFSRATLPTAASNKRWRLLPRLLPRSLGSLLVTRSQWAGSLLAGSLPRKLEG